jgi:hypothetical protein
MIYKFFYKWIWLLFFPFFSIFSQYQSFEISPIHPSAAGLASMGVGVKETGLNLATNSAFLSDSNQKYIEGGIFFAHQGTVSPILPNSMGFFYPLSDTDGFGFRFRTQYHSHFPGSERSHFLNSGLFYSTKMGEIFSISAGLGPGFGVRGTERSNTVLTGFIDFGANFKLFRIGLIANHPGGQLNYSLYRNGDSLKEKLPPFTALGISYIYNEKLEMYVELKKIFYEYSNFVLNNSENRPKFERGLGSELQTSIGINLKVQQESYWSIKSGFQLGGKYNSLGENKRGTGIGISFNYSPDPDLKSFNYMFGILDYSILSNKNSRDPETNFLFSIGYSW